MATTTKKKTVVKSSAPAQTPEVKNTVVEEPVVDETVEEVKVEVKAAPEPKPAPKPEIKAESVKPVRQFNQNDLILCRSVTAGWLGVSGKSGQYYVFENFGDECEIEYQDLFALKSRHSNYIYAPLFIIEDEELLGNPRWADISKFYDDEVFNKDVDEVLNLPVSNFKAALEKLPKGLAKTLQVKVAEKIEDGTFDSLQKIKVIDEVYGTDFRSIIAN